MRAWITKYALSKGIYEVQVEPPVAGHIFVGNDCFVGEGKDWHRSPEKAKARIADKLFTIRKQMAKLEKLIGGF